MAPCRSHEIDLPKAFTCLLILAFLLIWGFDGANGERVTDDLTSSSLIWQGFSHSWLRREAGFEIPHRIGSFGNSIQSQTFTSSEDFVAIANVTFTPGVDGDYAYPAVCYSGLATPSSPSSSSSPKVQFLHDSLFFHFLDNATETAHPVANTTISQLFNISLSSLSFDDTVSAFSVVLQGFQFYIWCDSSVQPDGRKCNSNAMWASKIWISIDDCALDYEQEETLQCIINLVIVRGWTPTDGGLKPFDYRLDFNVEVFFTAILSAGYVNTSSTGDQALPLYTIPGDILFAQSEIHKDGIMGSSKIYNANLSIPDPTVATTIATTALTGFGFELTETDGYKDLGRYFDSISFYVKDNQYDTATGTLLFDYVMEIHAPDTVLPSDIVYQMNPVMLQLVLENEEGTGSVFPSRNVTGEVCFDGFAFSCEKLKLPIRISDLVRFSD